MDKANVDRLPGIPGWERSIAARDAAPSPNFRGSESACNRMVLTVDRCVDNS